LAKKMVEEMENWLVDSLDTLTAVQKAVQKASKLGEPKVACLAQQWVGLKVDCWVALSVEQLADSKAL
jgi:hypothetical protein